MAEENKENLDNTTIEGLEEIKEKELPQPEALEVVDNSESDDEQQILEEAPSETSQEPTQEDTQEYGVQKKLGKLQKILIGVVGSLILIVVIGLILFLTGFFDPEEPIAEPTDQTQTQTEQPIVEEKPKYVFKSEDIDENRLNKKLALLTKYELVEDPEIEEQKALEQQAIINNINPQQEQNQQEQTNEQKVEQLVTNNKEETTEETNQQEQSTNQTTQEEQPNDQTTNEVVQETTEKPDLVLEIAQENTDQNDEADSLIPPVYEGEKFLKFIQVATLQYKLYNSFLSQIKDIDARISICKYKENQTQIFIGPFENETNRDMLIKKINATIVNDAFKIEFTQEEFDSRCNF